MKKISLAEHPLIKEGIETKIHYLNGLALVMNLDDKISDSEKAFFTSLLDIFQLKDSMLDDFVNFAKQLDPEQLNELFKELMKSELTKICFIIDCKIMAAIDKMVSKEAEELIRTFMELLFFTEKDTEFISSCKLSLDDIDYEKEYNRFKIDDLDGMIFVRGGTFLMGSDDGEKDEKPVHSVTVEDFYIERYEVTQKEWKEVMGSNPSCSKGDDLPVEKISWYDAVSFCNKKSISKGLTPCYSGRGVDIVCDWNANGYRLPTEAEWEYAARGGRKTGNFIFAGSNEVDEVACYDKIGLGRMDGAEIFNFLYNKIHD
ncbi:MAG: SUMF1/EgtB/PvdO family nonheme iron enzyme, partial [Candidatus Cloacimonetes bacterium]|nr:SUMF1/EgtB/PvdO family nonheme iron enzyme [Candidatus Cloacimonadota bacterium]